MGRHLRALLVALHLVAILVAALPSTQGLLHREAWKATSAQDEFALWTQRLGSLGLTLTTAELEESLWNVAEGYAAAVGTLRRPFLPYYRWCGTHQGWQMFPAPQRHPAVLNVQVNRNGTWRTVYAGRSDAHTWRRDFFDQDRVRTQVFLFGWPHMHRSRGYGHFAMYLRPMLRADFPDATAARLRFRRSRTRTPAEVHDDVVLPHRFEGTYTFGLEP